LPNFQSLSFNDLFEISQYEYPNIIKNQDALILYTAPFCAICKEYKEILKKLANDFLQNCVEFSIHVFNIENSGILADIYQFPSLILYKNKLKEPQIEYEGEMNKQEISDFIRKHYKCKQKISSNINATRTYIWHS